MAVLTLQAFTVLLHLVWWICTKILEGTSNLYVQQQTSDSSIMFVHIYQGKLHITDDCIIKSYVLYSHNKLMSTCTSTLLWSYSSNLSWQRLILTVFYRQNLQSNRNPAFSDFSPWSIRKMSDVHIAAVFWVLTQCSVSILMPIRVEGIGVWIDVEEIRVTPCLEHVHGMKEMS